jgi:glycosyltransferase involved in cell wall biosynthesis
MLKYCWRGEKLLKICLILEGSYPYVRGGVSSWANDLIKTLSQHEFVLWTIGDTREKRGKFLYKLPENVVEVHEVFLDEALDLRMTNKGGISFTARETEEILKMIRNEDPDWAVLFHCYNVKGVNPVAFLRSEHFLELLKEMCRSHYPYAAFSDLFYTVRSIILPLIFLMGGDVPQADIYHATATGYSGILGAMGAWKHKKPFIVTEHGIYTREREEEILRSKWVIPYFKDMWVSFFYMLSRCAYERADVVTSLFEHARNMQIDLGCLSQKCRVINNGVHYENYSDIPLKQKDGYIDIGAIVRIAPIKDIKTMIYSFAELKHTLPNAHLHILGGVDDEEYNMECHDLVNQLGVQDILFVGNTDVQEYMKKFDFTILTSISEAQPLAVIEAMSAGRACIVTDVGACREMVEGGGKDVLGQSGICIPPMHKVALTNAMMRLSSNEDLRTKMGEVGKKRAKKYFNHEIMIQSYLDTYERAVEQWRASDSN